MLIFVSTFAFAGLEATFAMRSNRQFSWGPEQNGYLFAFAGVFGAIIQGFFIGRLATKIGEVNLIISGGLSLSLGLTLIPFSTNLFALILAMIITIFGFSIITPSLNSFITGQLWRRKARSADGLNSINLNISSYSWPELRGLLVFLLR